MIITDIKTVTKEFIYRDSKYLLGYSKEAKMFLAINYNDIEVNPNGTLSPNKELNGFSMHLRKTLEAVMQEVKDIEDMSYYMNNGMTKGQAIAKIMNIPYTAQLENL